MKPRHTFRGVVLRNAPHAPLRSPAQPATPQPAAARVRVGREVAGRGGKAVTVISGLTWDAAQLDELATRLKPRSSAPAPLPPPTAKWYPPAFIAIE